MLSQQFDVSGCDVAQHSFFLATFNCKLFSFFRKIVSTKIKSWTRRMKRREHKLNEEQKRFYILYFWNIHLIISENLFQRVNSTCSCLWFERHDFFSIDLFCVSIFIVYSDPSTKRFFFVYFLLFLVCKQWEQWFKGVLNII